MRNRTNPERLLKQLQSREKLPDSWYYDALQWLAPVAQTVAQKHEARHKTLCVGINGAQGAGKSTMAEALALLLKHNHHLNTVTLSLDDFYLSRELRQTLGREIHPLLKTRGVPGTHNTGQALKIIGQLKDHKSVPIPRFDKATDDPVPEALWQCNSHAANIIILEGWCVGLEPQSTAELQTPTNELERLDDPDGSWRAYVNVRLANDYQQLFAECDLLVMLQAPGFEQIREWRTLQEQKLAAKQGADTKSSQPLMSPAEIERFIAHFERLTRHALKTLPSRADILLLLDQEHRIVSGRSQLAQFRH